jgi:hypothetical protein
MRQIAKSAQGIANPHCGRAAKRGPRQWPMNDHTSRAAAYRVTDKAMGIMALAFEGNEN